MSKLPVERQLEMLQVNITALTHMTRLFLPGMIERRRGGPTATNFAEAAKAGFSRRFLRLAMSAESVAQVGHRAFSNGQVVAVAGWRNRLLASSVRFGPRPVIRKLAKKFNAASYSS